MAVLDNTIKAADIAAAQDKLFVANFDHEVDKLIEVLSLFGVETATAGQAFYQYKVTGKLNDAEVEEGDETPLSHYKVEKVSFGEFEIHPYRKLVTAQAILKSGYENACLKTDRQMMKDIRADRLKQFFEFLKGEQITDISGKSSIKTATGETLQATLAHMQSTLGNALEDANDEVSDSDLVWFVNRNDIADYLADKEVTTQTLYGMTYIENFLGIVSNLFVTNKIEEKTLYVTPASNIHIYAPDFGELETAGLTYETSASNLIGIHHKPAYNRTSCETYALTGMTILPEVVDFIVKGTISPLP